MKKLSNADLRKLYLTRAMLIQIVQSVALQISGRNVGDSWKRELKRIQGLHQQVAAIVEDPQFEDLVPRPDVSHPSDIHYSPEGTLVNVVTTANEMGTYLDGLLALHLTPKSQELKQDPKATHKVFVGHGKNELVRSRVKTFLQDRCGFEVIILQELPSSGMTLIEKLEKYGRLADYAVLIFTPDDMSDEGTARARQNVVQELGWFQGVLGRNRTAILLQIGVEIPSNIAGIVRLDFEGEAVESQFEDLRREFEQAGLLSTPL